MNRLKQATLSLFLILMSGMAVAQTGGIKKAQESSTDVMRSDGKIYVVVAVIVVILTGLFLYLFNLDKKMTALEKNKS